MNTTEVELRTVEGKGFLEANQAMLEQCAVTSLLELMNSSVSPDIRLAASVAALKSLGKSEPKAAQPSNTTNIQINAALAGEAGKALAGLTQMAQLMAGGKAGNNAPQTPALTDEALHE